MRQVALRWVVWLVSGVVSSTNRAVAYLSAHQGRKRWSVLALLVVPQVETAPADDETTPPAPHMVGKKISKKTGHEYT